MKCKKYYESFLYDIKNFTDYQISGNIKIFWFLVEFVLYYFYNWFGKAFRQCSRKFIDVKANNLSTFAPKCTEVHQKGLYIYNMKQKQFTT